MEKYVLILLLLAMLMFSLCTFPAFSLEADNVYAVCTDSSIGDRLFTYSEKWSADGYFVYKIDKKDMEKAKILPNACVVKEYFTTNKNNIFTNPFMQKISYADSSVVGIPYVMD